MANARERVAIDRIDGVIKECASLHPTNPADTRAIFAHAPVIKKCLADVTLAIGAMRGQAWDMFDEYLTDAERRLGEHCDAEDRLQLEPRR